MQPESPLPCSEEPSTGLYPEPDRSSPYHPILFLLDVFYNYTPIYVKFFLAVSFLLGFSKINHPIRATYLAHLILLDLIILIILGEDKL
jgi:hypothetical protein